MALHITSVEYGPDHPDHPGGDKSDRMTAEEFRAGLKEIGFTQQGFAAFTGANPRTVRRWSDGEQDIPPYVPVMIALIGTVLDAGGVLPDDFVQRRQSALEARHKMGILVGKAETYIDHIDGDPTNNARENLRVVDKHGNPV
jgi:HNH endonuclease